MVQHQVTLIAFTGTANATSVADIVETSFKNASFFARRWMRDLEVSGIAALSPGQPLSEAKVRWLP
jgi:hypothetical protein